MAVHIINGDLLKSDCNIIAHQANCMSTMGSGIAIQIRKLYPEAYEADCSFNVSALNRLGEFSAAKITVKNGEILVGNLYGQYRYGTNRIHTNYDALKKALNNFVEYAISHCINKENMKIGLPYNIGCGLAGGDWTIVKGIIEQASATHNVDIYLYKLER